MCMFYFVGICSDVTPVRYSGDIWNVSNCEYCVCNQGNVQCHTAVCENIMCYQVSSNPWSFLAVYTVQCLHLGVSHARETTLSFFVMYLSPMMSEVYLLVNLFSKLNILRLFFS